MKCEAAALCACVRRNGFCCLCVADLCPPLHGGHEPQANGKDITKEYPCSAVSKISKLEDGFLEARACGRSWWWLALVVGVVVVVVL